MNMVDVGSLAFISALALLFLSSGGVFFVRKSFILVRIITLFGGLIGSSLALFAAITVILTKKRLNLNLWQIKPGMDLIFHLDLLAAIFLFLIALISFFVSWYSFSYSKKYEGEKSLALLGALTNSFLATMLIVVTADNFLTFLLAWESMSILSYLLVITDYEKPYVLRAGFIYIVMTHVGTIFLFLAFFSLYHLTGINQISELTSIIPQDNMAKNLLFFLFLIGFGTKAGIFPLHVWLPRAHPVAPSNISALMSAVMIKTALYGLIRFIVVIMGINSWWWGFVISIFGILSAVVGGLFGVLEKDMKRYLAYSSAENMGLMWMVLGVGMILTYENNLVLASIAYTTMFLHLYNHAIFKSLLFLGAGTVDYATHTKNMNLLGGLLKLMPKTAIIMLIGLLGMAAIPPFNGFYSEWLMMKNYFSLLHVEVDYSPFLAVLLITSLGIVGALTLAGTVNLFGSSFLARPRSKKAKYAVEVDNGMLMPMGFLASLIIIVGLFAPSIVDYLHNLIDIALFKSREVQVVVNSYLTAKPLFYLGSIILVTFLTYLIINLFYGRKKWQIVPTWGCGINLDEKMEYTASSFLHFNRQFFHPVVQSKQSTEKNHEYFVKNLKLTLETESFLEMKVYRPVLHLLFWFSGQVKRLQSGNIQFYLLVMFIFLILFLMLI